MPAIVQILFKYLGWGVFNYGLKYDLIDDAAKYVSFVVFFLLL